MNSAAPSPPGQENSEPAGLHQLPDHPEGVSSGCHTGKLLDDTLLQTSFPSRLTSLSPIRISWNHLLKELLELESWCQGPFGGNPIQERIAVKHRGFVVRGLRFKPGSGLYLDQVLNFSKPLLPSV